MIPEFNKFVFPIIRGKAPAFKWEPDPRPLSEQWAEMMKSLNDFDKHLRSNCTAERLCDVCVERMVRRGKTP